MLPESDTISVILNCYKRLDSLPLQISAIENQTIKPIEIFIWVNASEEYKTSNKSIFNKYKTVISNFNFGVWSRFYHAMNTTGKYVCVFDDDTIPGTKWFENCLSEMKKREGLYGTRGVIFDPSRDYRIAGDVGWHSGNLQTSEVDIVGHSWFFPRHFISAFCADTTIPYSSICGEDMHFSYTIQKFLKAKTFVPPHPVTDLQMWGSIPQHGIHWGTDQNAISNRSDIDEKFKSSLNLYRSKGFKLFLDK